MTNEFLDEFMTVQFLRDSVESFNAARDWQQWHKLPNLAKSIVIEAAELLELFQWDFTPAPREKLELELADIIIYCLSFANVCEIDITTAVLEKLQKNGEKYLAE